MPVSTSSGLRPVTLSASSRVRNQATFRCRPADRDGTAADHGYGLLSSTAVTRDPGNARSADVVSRSSSDQVTTPKESRQRQCEHNGRESVVKLKQKLAEEVAADAERRGPDNRATGIGDQKRAPGHAVYSGEERRQHAQ